MNIYSSSPGVVGLNGVNDSDGRSRRRVSRTLEVAPVGQEASQQSNSGSFLTSCLLISCVCQRSLMLKFKRIIVFLISSWFELLKILRILHNWTNRGTLQRSALLISSLYLNQLFCFQSQVAEGGSARSSFSGWIDETGLAVYTYPCIV